MLFYCFYEKNGTFWKKMVYSKGKAFLFPRKICKVFSGGGTPPTLLMKGMLMMKSLDAKTLARLVAPILIALFSFFVVGNITTTTEFHQSSIVSLQDRQNDVMVLAASSAAASAAMSAIPGDTTTPIANKLADLSAGFMVALTAIFLEKYFLVVGCYAAFKVLIPVACLIFLGGQLLHRFGWKTLAFKLAIFGLILSLPVPVSVRVSDYIQDTYDLSLQATLDAAQDATQSIEEGTTDDSQTEEKEGFLSGLVNSVTSGISQAADAVTDTVSSLVTRFVEALAMTLVTCCAIPLLVLLVFWWSFKLLFAPQMPTLPPRFSRQKVGAEATDSQKEEALV